MVLCFGTYATILKAGSLPGTTNRELVSTLVGTIDPDNQYGDKTNDTPVSRLMNCGGNFPSARTSSGSGAYRRTASSLTNIVSLAKTASADLLVGKFESVVDLLDEDKKCAVIGALHEVIKRDRSLYNEHRALFIKCLGSSATNIVKDKDVYLPHFLAGLFLYTVLTNKNDTDECKESLSEVKNDDLLNRFIQYRVTISDEYISPEPLSGKDIPDGAEEYMKKLVDKYNCLPTILHKEAFTPFRDYYVPNNVTWREKNPKEKYSYYIRTVPGVSLEKLMDLSRFLVLSGTGGLGKSMMMRNLLLSSIDDYENLGLIPLFITLKDYSGGYVNLIDYVYDMVCNLWIDLEKDDLAALLRAGKALVLFDGLDEINADPLKVFTAQLNSFVDRYSDNTFIISSRPYSNFQSFTRFLVLSLEPLTKLQALDLIDRFNYRADAPKLQQQFRTMFDKTLYRTHQGFADNPLLLSIMLLTFEMDAEIPTVKYIFYQEAYTVLSKRHDATKDGYTRTLRTGWSSSEFAQYFSFFCAVSYSEGKVSFNYQQMADYLLQVDKKYEIGKTEVDDFIYDATNSLCIMFQDGTDYCFIHRSFQEYFCARFFHGQLDEDLEYIIPIFDKNEVTKTDDSTLPMLFDMKPLAVERYLILPYLKNLIEECEKYGGVWEFLRKIYPLYEIADGNAIADDNACLPFSNLYAFILDHYEIELINISADSIPGIEEAIDERWYYREDTGEDICEHEMPSFYYDVHGYPDPTGYVYRFMWEELEESDSELHHYLESEESPFVQEYEAIKELTNELSKQARPKPSNMSIFDRMS